MRVAIPHTLGRDEVRRRLDANSGSIADAVPGGMAQISTSWTGTDRMTLDIHAMGQIITGHIDIEDSQVVFHIALPPALGFMGPAVQGAIQAQGDRLLAPPSKD